MSSVVNTVNKEFLRKKARESRKANGLIAITCFIFAAFVCAAFLFLSFFSIALAVIILPIIVFPVMLAFQRAVIYLRDDELLSFGLVFAGYRSYFSGRFISTYGFLREVWKVIVIYFATAFLGYLISFFVFYFTNFLQFYDLLTEIYSLRYLTVEALEQLLVKYEHTITVFSLTSNLPAAFIASIFALIAYSINSISFFLRISGVKYRGSYLKNIFIRFKKDNFSNLLKSFLYLNWPLLVLFLLGFGVGSFVGSLYQLELNSMFSFGIAFAFFLSFGIFGSFYFANKEALYYNYLPELERATEDIKKEVAMYLQSMRFGNNEIKVVEKEMEEEDDEEEDEEE